MSEQQGTILKLPSGFVFDFTNLYGAGKVTAEDVTAIEKRVNSAQQAIGIMRTTGIVCGHLSKQGQPEKVLFTQLPYIDEDGINTPASIERLKDFGTSLRYDTNTVVSFGVGGSYLGNKVLFDTYCGEFWNYKTTLERNGYPKLFFSGYNLDPRRTQELIEHILADARLKAAQEQTKVYKITLIVTSKSGTTLETLSNFMVVYDALQQYSSLIDISVVVITDPPDRDQSTPLYQLAIGKGWTIFNVPNGVGGRFSVFSEVGLITAACVGMDIEAFLAGARSMDEVCQNQDLWKNPALLNAVLKHIAAERFGLDIEVFMPYCDCLKAVAEWYVQLLAESLGKRHGRDGKNNFYGRTPMVAVGTTDMHAQTQQHQDGKRDKVIQFVKLAQWEKDLIVPNIFPKTQLEELASVHMSSALDIALEANAEALIRDDRFNATFVLPKLDAFHLGEFLFMLALSIAYEGELANIDAFDQPGVEAYKKIMGLKLKALKR